jgi:hypothetical protein
MALTTGERGRSPSADLHVKPYAKRHVKVYADTWVEVSSAETISASHLRETRSSTTVAATPALVKWVVS